MRDLTAVINVRNGQPFIEETLSSLFRQDYPVSVLVIDNQSTDDTAAVVAKFPLAQYVRTLQPLGLGAARSFSLSYVKTKYVAWLDSDDLWEPAFSASMRRAMEKASDAVLLTTGTICIDSEGKELPALEPYQRKYRIHPRRENKDRLEKGDTLEALLMTMRPRWAWCATVFKTDVVKDVGGFDPSLVYCEDLDIIAKVLRKGTSVHVPANLTKYRRHPNQDTRKLNPETIYHEKLLVLKRVGQDAGLLSRRRISEMERITEIKCLLTHFFRNRDLGKGLWAFAKCLDPRIFAYLIRRASFAI